MHMDAYLGVNMCTGGQLFQKWPFGSRMAMASCIIWSIYICVCIQYMYIYTDGESIDMEIEIETRDRDRGGGRARD